MNTYLQCHKIIQKPVARFWLTFYSFHTLLLYTKYIWKRITEKGNFSKRMIYYINFWYALLLFTTNYLQKHTLSSSNSILELFRVDIWWICHLELWKVIHDTSFSNQFLVLLCFFQLNSSIVLSYNRVLQGKLFKGKTFSMNVECKWIVSNKMIILDINRLEQKWALKETIYEKTMISSNRTDRSS